MDSSDHFLIFSQGRELRLDDTGLLYVDSVTIGDMIDRSYAGYQEVPLVAPEPVDGREVLIGVSFAALSAKIAD